MMNVSDKILLLGSNGLVGSAINRQLQSQGYHNILAPRRNELDLLDQQSTLAYFKRYRPQHVILAAAKVGGIHANNVYRADFIFQNLLIETNSFQAAFESDVENFLFLGSSCIYPKEAPQPIKESYLLTGPLEPTNEPYAIAKIAGLKMAESFRRQYNRNFFSAMPTNLYGEGDNFHLENSHVIPGLIARMSKAKKENLSQFQIWGSGKQKREFLYVDDMAKACIFLMKFPGEAPDLVNIGTGEDVSIRDLAYLIRDLIGYNGELIFDTSKPDGTMRKLLDVSLIKSLGWKPEVDLSNGLKKTIEFYNKTYGSALSN